MTDLQIINDKIYRLNISIHRARVYGMDKTEQALLKARSILTRQRRDLETTYDS